MANLPPFETLRSLTIEEIAARLPPRPSPFAQLRDRVFLELETGIRLRYRPWNAMPIAPVRLAHLEALEQLEFWVEGQERWPFRVDRPRGIDMAMLRRVDFERICELFYSGAVEQFVRSPIDRFDWRRDHELRDRLEFAERGEPLRFYSLGVDLGREIVTIMPGEYTTTQAVLPDTPQVTATQLAEMLQQVRETNERMLASYVVVEPPVTMTPYTAWYGGLAPPVRSDRAAAEQRGERLLREWLTPEQRAQYEQRGDFEVRGEVSGKRYRIVRAASFNVHELDDAGQVQSRICFMPEGNLVPGDMMLAQKIALETDERAALAVANREGQFWLGARPCTCLLCRYPGPFLDDTPAAERTEQISVRRVREEPEVHPNSWLANWGRMGRDFLAGSGRGRSSRAARRRR